MVSREVLQENLESLSAPYIGRIVIVGLSEDGQFWRLFTGMGGRSAGSNNRYYRQLPDLNGHGDYIKTEVHDTTLQKGDPSTTLYVAHRSRRGWHVASNGEQTEGISIALALGRSFEEGQRLYQNEGANADYTARISAAVHANGSTAIMGKIVRNPQYFEESIYYSYYLGPGCELSLNPGEACFITTYDGKGGTDPDYLPPRKILLPGSLEQNMDMLWESWKQNKAGLAGKEIRRGTGEFRYAFRSIHPGRG